jgi:diadenylate cyclase
VVAILENISFILQRLTWWSALDILLVTVIIFAILLLLRDTQAVVLVRGVLIILILLGVLTGFEVLPAFSWLVRTTLPALLVAIPVIFAPEIRRALERVGRASNILPFTAGIQGMQEVIEIVVRAVDQLSDLRYGALIVMGRFDPLKEYGETGIPLNAQVSEKLLIQIFYPNTPLHDGAVIMEGSQIMVAAAVMPLATGDIQAQSPRRRLGLRHRAAIGISEATDAVAVVVSEETGAISIASGGRIIRRLDTARLRNILTGFYRPLEEKQGLEGWLGRLFQRRARQEK